MSYPIMEALYHGEIHPWERHSVRSAARKELAERIESEQRYFVEKMSLDDCGRFQAMMGLLIEERVEEEVEVYSHGLTLGALLVLEIMAKKDAILD